MSQMAPTQHFPRPALFAVGAVLAGTVLAAGYGRLAPRPSVVSEAPVLAQRALRFEDRPDGAVAVLDAGTGRLIEVMAPGTNAFLRATLRGLAQQRMREALGPEVPFKLTAWGDGRLTLEDTETRRTVELEAFGHSNALVFAAILAAPEAPP